MISVTRNRLLKTQAPEKKGKISSEQKFFGQVSLYYRVFQTSGMNYGGPSSVLTATMEVIRSFM